MEKVPLSSTSTSTRKGKGEWGFRQGEVILPTDWMQNVKKVKRENALSTQKRGGGVPKEDESKRSFVRLESRKKKKGSLLSKE